MVLWQDFLAARVAEFIVMLGDPVQRLAIIAAVVAAVLILVSSLVKTIIPLRWLAVGGNVGFVLYGALHPAPLVLALHLALLPINLWRVLEMQRLTRRISRAELAGEGLDVWLQPYMKRHRRRRGAVLFKRGDRADRLYVLAEGRLELVESGRTIEAGQMFGEIAFFAPARRRTATVRCLEPSTLLSIDETSFRQLFFQNPAFGFAVVRLIAARLSADVQRLEAQLTPIATAPSGVDAPAAQAAADASAAPAAADASAAPAAADASAAPADPDAAGGSAPTAADPAPAAVYTAARPPASREAAPETRSPQGDA